MADRRSSFEFEDLLTCGRGELFGPGNAQLPLPPMLMFDRISEISETGGAHGKGFLVAELKVAGNPRLDWFFDCHFKGDPVMPGCLGLDAMWQLVGFWLGWRGNPGRGRALGAPAQPIVHALPASAPLGDALADEAHRVGGAAVASTTTAGTLPRLPARG